MPNAFIRDVRLAARSLSRQPGYAAVIVVTLALGIGATTTIFSAYHGVLLEPLPYSDPAELVRLYQTRADEPGELRYVTGAHFLAYRDETTSFEQVASVYTYTERGADLVTADGARRLRLLPVSAGYFDVLGASPVLGRGFDRGDETDEPRAVVSNELWRTVLGGRPDAVGGSIRLDDRPYTVVGVAPAGLEDPLSGRVDVWIPEDLRPGDGRIAAYNNWLSVLARLRPGVQPERAAVELARLDALLNERFADEADPSRTVVVPLGTDLVRGADRTLAVLLAAVGLVLLIVCVNVANLFLIRGTGRERELSIRAALGSGRARLVRQLLAESLLLATAGGAAGVLLAIGGIEVLAAVAAGSIPRVEEIGLDGRILTFAAALSVATGVLFGIAPALRFSRARAEDALRGTGRATSTGRRTVRLRDGLVVAQIAVALTLLAGAGLLIASFQRLGEVELGFRTDGVVTFEVNLPTARYDAAGRARFHEDLTTRLEALPGVVAAGAVSRLPATGTYHSWGTRPLTGPRAGEDGSSMQGQQRVVAGNYFEAAGIRLLEGRFFSDLAVEGLTGSGREIVLSRAAADLLFPGTSAVGQRVSVGGEHEVIGVVSDVALTPEGDVAPAVYHAHTQFAGNRNWSLQQVAATTLDDPYAIVSALRTALAELDPQLVLHEPAALDALVGRGVGQRRFALVLLTTFAALALGLAALGLYGVLGYSVRQRTRELAIRSALGARRAQVQRLVLGHGVGLVVAGAAVGLIGALALGRVLSSLVFRTGTADPAVLGTAVLTLVAASLIAAWIPARRATAVEPRQALEAE